MRTRFHANCLIPARFLKNRSQCLMAIPRPLMTSRVEWCHSRKRRETSFAKLTLGGFGTVVLSKVSVVPSRSKVSRSSQGISWISLGLLDWGSILDTGQSKAGAEISGDTIAWRPVRDNCGCVEGVESDSTEKAASLWAMEVPAETLRDCVGRGTLYWVASDMTRPCKLARWVCTAPNS